MNVSAYDLICVSTKDSEYPQPDGSVRKSHQATFIQQDDSNAYTFKLDDAVVGAFRQFGCYNLDLSLYEYDRQLRAKVTGYAEC